MSAEAKQHILALLSTAILDSSAALLDPGRQGEQPLLSRIRNLLALLAEYVPNHGMKLIQSDITSSIIVGLLRTAYLLPLVDDVSSEQLSISELAQKTWSRTLGQLDGIHQERLAGLITSDILDHLKDVHTNMQ